MKQRAPKHVIATLRQLRGLATFTTAAFGMPDETVVGRPSASMMSKPVEVPTDEFIKERTRIFRETWMIPELDKLIEWAEGGNS